MFPAGKIRALADEMSGPVSARQYPGDVRLTTFWDMMRAQFGEQYAQSVAKDFVFANLGERTVERALADGVGRQGGLAGGLRHVQRAREHALRTKHAALPAAPPSTGPRIGRCTARLEAHRLTTKSRVKAGAVPSRLSRVQFALQKGHSRVRECLSGTWPLTAGADDEAAVEESLCLEELLPLRVCDDVFSTVFTGFGPVGWPWLQMSGAAPCTRAGTRALSAVGRKQIERARGAGQPRRRP